MKLQTFVVYLAACFFIFYGLAFSVTPNVMSELVTGSGLDNISALVDFRATYGGMTVSVGFIILCLYKIGQVRSILLAVVVVLLSMATTRSLGFFLDGTTNVLMYVYLLLELLGGGLAWFAMQGLAKQK